jgi:hypothetical protein
MFVRYESGLCPRCFNGHRAQQTEAVVRDILLELEEFGAEPEDTGAN